jgi:transcriptional regulator with XRE-family HTH domain
MDATSDTDRSRRFRDQILVLRGRVRLTQREVAVPLGVSERTIQKWEAGLGYPSPARLQALIALYLERGVFMVGHEAEEVEALWEALRRATRQRTPPFDATWFAPPHH